MKYMLTTIPVSNMERSIDFYHGLLEMLEQKTSANPGVTFYFITDPDGYRIQLHQKIGK